MNYKSIRSLIENAEVEIKTGPFGTQLKASEYTDVGIPVLNVKNLGYSRVVSEKLDHVNQTTLDRLSMHVLQSGDIVFGRKGAVDRHAFISVKENGWMQGSDCIRLRLLTDSYNPRFLSYYFMTNKHRSFMEMMCSHGTTMASLNQRIIELIEIPDLERKIQDKIVSILESVDSLIDNNARVNQNLEQQAQTLFKSWFLDYEPWNGTAPDSWIDGKLGDFTEIKRGGSPRPIQEYLSDSGLRWLKISDVTSLQTPFVIDIKDHIIEEGLKKTVFLKAGSLVLSNSATPGVPKILDVDSCIHDGWLYFPKSKLSKEYLYLFFKYIRQQLVNLSNGSVFNNLKTAILKGYPTILPDDETLKRFDDVVKPMFIQMKILTRENHRLAEMRDVILPQLMSGELDVSKLEL